MGQTLSEPNKDKTSTHDANKKYFYGCSSMQGWRLTMEDSHTTLLKLGDTDASFFAVYDGHGGSTIADYTGHTLYKKVLQSEYFKKKQYAHAMKDAFMSLDKSLSEDHNFAYDPSGCTAVTALVTPDNHIVVANAGDSRAVISISGKVKPLSYDHKPSNDGEMERIVKAGGYVDFGRVNGNLALSRAIGDFEFKQNEDLPAEEQIVTCNPDIIDHTITDDDEFFVLACDGIWDCMSNQEVVDYVRREAADDIPLEKICEDIMENCVADDDTANGLGYDNMSIMIIGILNGKSKAEWYESIKNKVRPTKTVNVPTKTVAESAKPVNVPAKTATELSKPVTVPTNTTTTTNVTPATVTTSTTPTVSATPGKTAGLARPTGTDKTSHQEIK